MIRGQEAYRQPLLPNIDWRIALWQSYLNCLNSFQALETTSAMEEGASLMFTRASMERFVYHLGILDGQLERDKAEAAKNGFDFRKEYGEYQWKGWQILSDKSPDWNPFKYWRGLVELMRTMGFFKASGFEGNL